MTVAVAQISDAAPIRREGGEAQGTSGIGDTSWLTPVSRYDPEVCSIVVVAVLMASGDEGQVRAVGGPGRVRIGDIALGELLRFAALGRNGAASRAATTSTATAG